MIVSDPGHAYNVLWFDPEGKEPALIPRRGSSITFFKKIGEKFPGNEGSPAWGTNSQEVIRVLLDRARYLNIQIPCKETDSVIYYLRRALFAFELRAARVKDMRLPEDISVDRIEEFPFCNICGHIYPHSHTGDKP
jgi:hypothetical protein